MNLILFSADLAAAAILFFPGLFFLKEKHPEKSILFLAGDYSGCNAGKICSVTGKRMLLWAVFFLLGAIVDLLKPGVGIALAAILFVIFLAIHLADMTVNRKRKYRL
jgi:Flp pilus assembly protein TadB